MKIIEAKPAAVSDAELQEPIEYTAFEIPVMEAKKPVEYTPNVLGDAKLKEPVLCIPKRISDKDIRKTDLEMRRPEDRFPKRKTDLEFMKLVERTIPAQLHEAETVLAEAATQIADFAPKPLHTTMAQVVPATQELGQLLDETRCKTSDLKKTQQFAENILHINPRC